MILRLGTPQWVLDLLLLVSALCWAFSIFWLSVMIPIPESRGPNAPLVVGVGLFGAVLLAVAGCMLRWPDHGRTAAVIASCLLPLSCVFAPVGMAIAVGVFRTTPGTWIYPRPPRWVGLALLAPLLAWAALGAALSVATGQPVLVVPVASWLAAITAVGASGILLGRPWARPIAGVAALLGALTGAGLPVAIVSLAALWRGARREPRDVLQGHQAITTADEPTTTTDDDDSLISVAGEVDAIHREWSDRSTIVEGCHSLSLRRRYEAPIEHVWKACTHGSFLPITGDLPVGGTYRIEGMATGEIVRCEPPRLLDVTWVYEDPRIRDAGSTQVQLLLTAGPAEDTNLELRQALPAVMVERVLERHGTVALIGIGILWDLILISASVSVRVSGWPAARTGTEDPAEPVRLVTDETLLAKSAEAWAAAIEAAGIASAAQIAEDTARLGWDEGAD